MAAHLGYRRRSGIEVSADQVAPFLGVELGSNAGRADEIAEHDREIAALSGGFSRWGERRRRHRGRDRRRNDGRCGRGCRHRRGCSVQCGDRPQNLAPVTERGNADLFQILIGQIGEDREIDIILGETRRVLAKPEISQPLFDRPHCNPHPLNAGRVTGPVPNDETNDSRGSLRESRRPQLFARGSYQRGQGQSIRPRRWLNNPSRAARCSRAPPAGGRRRRSAGAIPR